MVDLICKMNIFNISSETNTLVIRINTDKGNVFNLRAIEELIRIFEDIENDDNIHAVIITGERTVFSIGGDLEYIKSFNNYAEVDQFFKKMDYLLLKLFSFEKILISAINGHCIGLGFLIALCSDYIICFDNKKIKFGLPESKIGMVLDKLMLDILKFNNLSGRKLNEIILNGELFNVDMFNEFVKPLKVSELDNLMKVSLDLIMKIDTNVTLRSFKLNKSLIRHDSISSINQHNVDESYLVYRQCFNF